jgi:hypothetical protein
LSTGFAISETITLGIGAGPQVSFNLSCNEKIPGEPDFDCKEYEDYIGSTDFGLVGTAALFFPMGNSTIGVGGGYDLGLKDVFEEIEGGDLCDDGRRQLTSRHGGSGRSKRDVYPIEALRGSIRAQRLGRVQPRRAACG